MKTEPLVVPKLKVEEKQLELSLRPKKLSEFIGQKKL